MRLGQLEYHPARFNTKDENSAFNVSIREFNERELNCNNRMRLSGIVDEDDESMVHSRIVHLLDEALDAIDLFKAPLSNYSLMEAGICRNLSTGKVQPRVPEKSLPYRGFRFVRDSIQVFEPERLILDLQSKNNKLCQRLLRSSHWSRKSSHESSYQLRLLFLWFSIESLLRAKRDDNIIHFLLLSLAFLHGETCNMFVRELRSVNLQIPLYRNYRKKINKQLDRIRTYRNQSIHNGFREWDIEPNTLLRDLNLVFHLSKRVQHYAIEALQSGITDIYEFREYLPIIVDNSNICQTAKRSIELINTDIDKIRKFHCT